MVRSPQVPRLDRSQLRYFFLFCGTINADFSWQQPQRYLPSAKLLNRCSTCLSEWNHSVSVFQSFISEFITDVEAMYLYPGLEKQTTFWTRRIGSKPSSTSPDSEKLLTASTILNLTATIIYKPIHSQFPDLLNLPTWTGIRDYG